MLPGLQAQLCIVLCCQGYREGYMEDIAFMTNAIWPRVNRVAFCHDSVSCAKWVNAFPFPVQRRGAEFVGQFRFLPSGVMK